MIFLCKFTIRNGIYGQTYFGVCFTFFATVKLEVQLLHRLPPSLERSGKGGGRRWKPGIRVIRQYKIKKGDLCLPRINYFETLEMIARSIGVHKSTVSREIKRNSTPSGKYVWNKAHDMAESRRCHTPGNRGLDDVLQWRIIEFIKNEQWSPRQISGRLKLEGINVSHEAIYALIRKDESGELASHCRHKMKYKRKASHRHETKATNIRNRVSIHERPAEADGKRFGDWEMDLIVDKDSNAILTLTERSTNFLLMERLKHGKKAKPVARTVWRLLLPYKGEALKSITTDNGSEFAEHEWITKKLNVPVYFADSYCAWQKGAIENGNKLIRQYIPKGTDISTVTEGKITKIRKKINARPREKLNFSTPAEVFFKNIS